MKQELNCVSLHLRYNFLQGGLNLLQVAFIYLYQTAKVCQKALSKLNDPDVGAKKKRGIQYCEVASRWSRANGYKEWRYLFIPSKQVMVNSSFGQLALQYKAL